MRDARAIRRWLDSVALIDELDDAECDLFANNASWVTLEAGDVLHAADADPDALWLLVDGEIHLGRSDGATSSVDGVAVRAITTPGYPLGWDGFVGEDGYRWDAVATAPTRVLRVARDVLDDHCAHDDEAAARVYRWLLWLAGAQLRSQHTRLVARRYDDAIDAVADLIADRAPTLRATSALHRVPGYLRSRPTVADAFRVLEVVRDGDTAVEATVARQALELLDGVRRELQLYLAMQRVYESVASAPEDAGPEQVRAASCRALIDMFALTRYRIEGLDKLPDKPGSIVLCNHLRGHPNNRLPNGFLIILDVHFVSSMVLYRTYGHAPIRVVRDSHWDEAGHARYYPRLGYIMVPSYQVDRLPPEQREQRRLQFVAQASEVLRSGTDLVICPEGRTGPTEGSPGRMRPGAFLLASEIDPEPPIVPVALANFEKRMTDAHLGAVIGDPFLVSDVVDDPTDRDQVTAFVNDDLTPRYRAWVARAAALR